METRVSKPLGLMAAVVILALAAGLVVTPAFAGHNASHKLAIHVKAHPTSCTKSYPVITTCDQINETWAATGDLDVMPVFFNLSDYTVVEFALTWPAEWGTTSWTRCKGDIAVGGIHNPGEGTAIAWTTCQYGSSILPGYGWLYATGAGMVRAIPNPATAMYGTVDCSDPFEYDFPMAVYAAGIGGATGDDPCIVPIVPLTLSKSDNIGLSACVATGGSVTYTLNYGNPNSSAVNNATLTDFLPADVQYVSNTGGGAYDAGNHKVVWGLGTLAGSSTGSVTVSVTVKPTAPTGSAIVNNSEIASDETPTPKTAQVSTNICACLIEGPDTACPGSKLQFCGPTGMSSWAWSVTGNAVVFGPANQRCVTIWANTTCNESYTVRLTVDDGGIVSQCQKEVPVEDTTDPQITSCPANQDLQCRTDLPAPNINLVTATDNCGSVTVSHGGDVVNGSSCNGSVVRTYRATDQCGNFVECVQTFTILDTTDPVFTQACPNDTTVECDAIPTAPTLTATDNCDAAVDVNYSEVPTAGSCPQSYTLTRTWTAVDDCGNDTQCVQVITVEDTTAPQITSCPADDDLQCLADVPAPDINLVVATDNCGTVAVTYEGDQLTGTDCNGTVVRTYRATDECGNSTECVQTFTILDTTDPVFVEACPTDATVDCDAIPTAPTMTATDNCDTDVTVNYSEVPSAGSCPQSYTLTRTWTAVDDCGNDVQCVQTITVEDTEAPSLVCAGDARVACGSPIIFTDPSVTDNCDPSPALNDLGETSTPGPGPGEVTHTKCWTATDACANTSGSCCQNIVEESCAYLPLTLSKDDGRTGCFYPEENITYSISYGNPNALEVHDVALTDEIPAGTDFVSATGGGIESAGTVTWSLGTLAGLGSGSVDVVVQVQAAVAPGAVLGNDCEIASTETSPTGFHLDTPVCACMITGPAEVCPGSIRQFCGPTGVAGYDWSVSGDGTITTATGIQCVDVRAGGDCDTGFELTLEVVESGGGTSTCHLSVSIYDNAAPEVTCPPDTLFECDDIGDAGVATATDNCSQSPAVNFEDNVVAGACPDSYVIQRTWFALDACSNRGECVQTITIVDSEAPEIVCAPDERIGCGDAVVFTDPTATDNCDGTPDIIAVSTDTTAVPATGEIEYVRCWEASDRCGNAVQCCQTITREACPIVPLRLTKDDGLAAAVGPGDAIAYTITLYNDNAREATNALVIDLLPPEVNFVSASAPSVFDDGDRAVYWGFASIAPLASVVLTLNVQVDSEALSGQVINTVSATSLLTPVPGAAAETTEVISTKTKVYVDVKPGICPNSLNPAGNGVLQVAVLGTADLDVNDINLTTVAIGREGVASTVSPTQSAFADVATPFTGELCGCHALGADGQQDLSLSFSVPTVVTTLGLNSIKGRNIEIILTGALMDGTPITGKDCLKILGRAGDNEGKGQFSAPLATGFDLGDQVALRNADFCLMFHTAGTAQVRLDVFDVHGRLVRDLVDAELDAGSHSVTWNLCSTFGDRIPAGIYFVRLSTPEVGATKKLIVVE